MGQGSFFQDLSKADVAEIHARGVSLRVPGGHTIFSEGDPVGEFYIIESGEVSIFIEKAGRKEEICVLGAGEYFGEMAIFSHDERTASAMASKDSVLLSVDKDRFLDFVRTHPNLSERISALLAKREEELVLRESLIDTTGLNVDRLSLSIKGDPSMRESAFSRERYQSVVDQVLPTLQYKLEDLLLNRSVYKVFVNFNSGEIRTSSVFDPFNEEIHTANKLTYRGYIHRHFPEISYEEKTAMIRAVYGFIQGDAHFSELPMHWKNIFNKSRKVWNPVPKEDISRVITKLTQLRSIPDFYLRNFNISMIQDVIRMQFNCDGTHLVSSGAYQRFLDENLV